MVIFNNVFVPNERVFLKGEFNYAAVFANLFATLHRFSYTACKPALYDLMTGAAMLITEYNGTRGEYFLSNNSEKILEIYKTSIMVQAMAKAAIEDATETESGVLFPDPVYSNMGKYISSQNFHTAIATLQDLSGALPTNLPYSELLDDPDYGKQVRDLFARKKGVSAEEHYRVNELIRTFVASNESGLLQFGSKHGGGNKEAEKVAIYANSIRKLNECKKLFKKMAFEDS
jgi:aromatic ring hydroxylase